LRKAAVLLVAYAVVDEDEAVAVLYEQAAHGPCAEVVGIGRVGALPKLFGHHPEHGATVQFEEPCIYCVKSHFFCFICQKWRHP
jgi:hypothetical protein